MYNIPRGSALAIMLLIPALIAFLVEKYWVSQKSFITVTGKPTGAKQDMVSPITKKLLLGFLSSLTFIILLFYMSVIAGSFFKLWGIDYSLTLEHFKYSWDVGFDSIKDTLILAGAATPFTGLLGMVLTGDVFNLYVFLEISSLAGYGLIAAIKPTKEINTAITPAKGSTTYSIPQGGSQPPK